jgi:hypothetical protein
MHFLYNCKIKTSVILTCSALVADGLPLRIEMYGHCLSLRVRDRKRRLNGFELLESMHLLGPAGGVVLTTGVVLSLLLESLALFVRHMT